MKKMRKGFTLIELLIVISVVGMLAAMMSMSSMEAMTTAKTAKIIANLRTFAAAANEYYFDNLNKLYGKEDANKPDMGEIKKYMNQGIGNTTSVPESKLENYYLITADASSTSYAEVDWYIGYKFPENIGAEESKAIKEKLNNRALEIGLYGSAGSDTAPTGAGATAYNSHAVVWMKVREKSQR